MLRRLPGLELGLGRSWGEWGQRGSTLGTQEPLGNPGLADWSWPLAQSMPQEQGWCALQGRCSGMLYQNLLFPQ